MPNFDQVKAILAFLTSSIVVIVIGRLWTLSYFRHFGLSTGDLEFTTQDFAFRSLEVLVSLSLAGVGLLVASSVKMERQPVPWPILAGAVVFVAGGVLVLLKWVGDDVWFLKFVGPWLTSPGVMGVISGVALSILILLVVAIWRQVPDNAWWAGWPTPLKNQIAAGCLMLAIVFIYLPLITQQLAELDARLDLIRGDLPVAILETVKDPLPPDIASDEDPKKSNLVRVVLAQKENTYVLDSMRCKTIGEPKVKDDDKDKEEDESFSREADVCKVFAIATKRLESIEYRSVKGNPPQNDTPSLAAKVGLREPFRATVSTRGATDDKKIRCQNQKLHKTMWFEVTPADEGVLLVRADSLTEELSPVIGVWRDSGDAVPERDAAPGSDADQRACEIRTDAVPTKEAKSLGAPEGVERVGTLANLRANETYLIGLGANESMSGEFRVFIQFFPNGSFLATNVEPKIRPEIELRSTLGRVTLELRRFYKDYTLGPLLDCNIRAVANQDEICVFVDKYGVRELRDDQGKAVTFSMESEEGLQVPFTLVQDDDGDREHQTVEARGLLGATSWHLIPRGQFKTLASLTIPGLQPNLVLALNGRLDDTRELRALAAVLHPTQLELEGSVVFVQGLNQAALGPTPEEQALDADEALRTLPRLFEALCVNIIAAEQGQQTAEKQLLLGHAVAVVEKKLEDLGATVNGTVGQCTQISIRIFLINLQPEAMAESDVSVE